VGTTDANAPTCFAKQALTPQHDDSQKPEERNMDPCRDLIVIGTSLGGIKALSLLASSLGRDFPGALLVVLHTGPGSPMMLDRIIQRNTTLSVAYARNGDSIRAGHMYIAPPDRHLVVNSDKTLHLDSGPKLHRMRPAADRLFETAAEYYGPRVAGVVLTGVGVDGTLGLQKIRLAGGIGIVQHPAQAEAPGMPMSALDGDHPSFSVSVAELGPLLKELAEPQAQS
jgi:two-component system, chemotaxis family, protein-glutamate methylesterase/glutaminase